MVSAFIDKTSSVQTGAKREGAFVFPWLLGLELCLGLKILRHSADPPYLRSTILLNNYGIVFPLFANIAA